MEHDSICDIHVTYVRSVLFERSACAAVDNEVRLQEFYSLERCQCRRLASDEAAAVLLSVDNDAQCVFVRDLFLIKLTR